MMNSVRILSGLLIGSWILHAAAAPRSFADQAGDAHYWQSLDWSTAANSAVWLDHNWVSYLGKQNNGETRDKIQAFRMEGHEWQATLSKRISQPAVSHLLTIYTPADDAPKEQCDILYRWAARHFGMPQISMDGSYQLPAVDNYPEHRTVDRHYQWDLGNTRVTQECLGQFASSGTAGEQTGYASSSLRFTPKDGTAELHPLISAKCSRVLRLEGSSDIPLKMSDIGFVIDENNSSIRRADLVPLRVRNVLVSGNEVRFSLTLDKSNNVYQIDRPGGALSAAMSIAGIRAGSVSGQCALTPILTAQQGQ